MAGLTVPPVFAVQHFLCPRQSLRGLPRQLHEIPRALLGSGSRASYFRACREELPLRGRGAKREITKRLKGDVERRERLTTASVRCAQPDGVGRGHKEGGLPGRSIGTQPAPPDPVPNRESSKLPQTGGAATLRETLKTRVSALRSHENIYTLPNILTFSRLVATPVIGYLIIHNQHLYAFSLFAYAGFSDLLDGWIARRWNLQTVVGSVVDPMADKALMTTLVGCLAVNGALPLPLATLILGRDVSLAVAAIYYRYASLPVPKTFRRYWDFSLPSAEVHPTTVSKFNTFLQLGLIGTTMCVGLLHDPSALNSVAGGYLQAVQAGLGGPEGVQTLVRGMQGVVATTTIYSGLSYVWTKDAVTILGDNELLKRKQGFRGRMVVGGCFGAVISVAAWLAWRDMHRDAQVDGEEKS